MTKNRGDRLLRKLAKIGSEGKCYEYLKSLIMNGPDGEAVYKPTCPCCEAANIIGKRDKQNEK